MSSSTQPPAAGVAAPERDVLLATKLHMPVPRPGLLQRPRLVDRLDQGVRQGLALVCAPAGSGKTVLLAEWAYQAERSAAWLSLDAGDNDPARFWRHVVAALDRVRPGTARRVGPLLGPPSPPSFAELVTALVNDLSERSSDDGVQLVLDDYHVIVSQDVHASLGFLLEHRPPGLHVVMASRSDPPLALARLRARGELAEVRVADLRFTVDETAALLQQGASAGLPDTAVAALAARTEGWAAGLHLAALSLRGHADAEAFVAGFTGSHRYVLDYLAEEVLERQDEQMGAFLLETSVLERLNGALCDEVTGRTGSQAMLEQVERAGLFLLPLDDVRGWWRYHHLFADLLRARLRQQPGREAALHRNAAAWHEEHDLPDEAILHALAAGETAWAARLIERHFDAVFYRRGEGGTIQRWLSALPAGIVRSRPRLLLAQAALAAANARVEEVDPAIDAAESAFADAAEEPFEPSVGRAGSLLANVPAAIALFRAHLAHFRGDAEYTAREAAAALAVIGEDEHMLQSTAQAHLAAAEWVRGRLREAERGFAASMAGWRAIGQPTVTAWGCHVLSQVQLAQGRLDAAARTCQETLEATAGPAGRPLPAAGAAFIGLGQVAYQRNDLDSALELLTKGIALCRQLVYTPPVASGLVALAWLRQARGDPAGALDAINDAEAAPPDAGVTSLLNPVPVQRARLLLAQGRLAASASWAKEHGLRADAEPGYSREPEQLLVARLLLAQGQPGQALALLDRLHTSALAQDRMGSVIEIGALRVLALAASGQAAAALGALAEALRLACPQGYVRVFADEGPPMAALFGQLIAAQRSGQLNDDFPLACVTQIMRAFSHQQPEPGPGQAATRVVVPDLVEQLTARELEVLSLMAAGHSNQFISRELVVSLDTVKKHVSHILSKLAAANRTEAVTRARELGLIP